MDGDTPLQAAAQAVLQRNAQIVLALDGERRRHRGVSRTLPAAQHLPASSLHRRADTGGDLRPPLRSGSARLRAGAPPSDSERQLFAELQDNLVALAALLPPRAVLPAEQPPMQTFLATSRAMGASCSARRSTARPLCGRTRLPEQRRPLRCGVAGLLPLPGDFQPLDAPQTEPAGEPAAGGGEDAAVQEPPKAPRQPVRRLAPGERASLRRRLPGPPKGFTGRAFHNLNSLDKVEFYEEARSVRLRWQLCALVRT